MESWPKIALVLVGIALLALAFGIPSLLRTFRRAITTESPLPFGKMMKRLGVSPDDALGSEHELAVAASRCGSCKSEEECRKWLASSARPGSPDFCPNRVFLAELKQVGEQGRAADPK